MFNISKLFDDSRNLFSKISMTSLGQKFILPMRYFFELTHRCNLKCPYCYLGNERVEKELTYEEWLDVIKQIPFYSIVTLVGGEPLVREDFTQIFEAVSRRTFNKTHLVTNGVFLNDNIIDSLIKNKLMLLSVSLDGYKEHHDIYRGAKGTFDKVIRNLDNLSSRCAFEKRNIMVDIKTIILKDNLEDILKLYEYASNKGFEYLSLSFLRNNNLKQNPILHYSFDESFYKTKYPIELYFDMDEFERIYLEIQKMKKYSKTQIRFSPKFDNIDSKLELNSIKKFFLDDRKKPVSELYYPCLYPWANVVINPMGDIYPCLSYRIGNIKNDSLRNLMRNKNSLSFRSKLKEKGVFEACSMCCELKVK